LVERGRVAGGGMQGYEREYGCYHKLRKLYDVMESGALIGAGMSTDNFGFSWKS